MRKLEVSVYIVYIIVHAILVTLQSFVQKLLFDYTNNVWCSYHTPHAQTKMGSSEPGAHSLWRIHSWKKNLVIKIHVTTTIIIPNPPPNKVSTKTHPLRGKKFWIRAWILKKTSIKTFNFTFGRNQTKKNGELHWNHGYLSIS